MIKTGRFGNDRDLPAESPGRRGDAEIRVTKNVGKIEPTFACQPFGVNGKPATWASIQNVSMVYVTVKDDAAMIEVNSILCETVACHL